MKKIKIAFSVGEDSGDFLGAELIKNLKKKYPDAEFIGLGGHYMKKEGLDSLFNIDDLSVMGLIDPLLNISKLLKRRKQLLNFLLREKPDLFIGIDSPSFNSGIAKKIKSKSDIKTIQYVCPQFWAWRKGRVKRFKNYLDHIFSIFPFEENLLKKEGVSSNFTGHPLAENFEMDIDKKISKQKLGFGEEKKYIALLPGSRKSEIKNHLKILEDLTKIYSSLNSNYQFVLSLTKDNSISEEKYLEEKNITLIKGNTREVLKACDYGVVSSGTATLEAMLSKTPICVIYKSNALSNFVISSILLKLDYISLPNILANKKIIPELRQNNVTSRKIKHELDNLIKGSNENMLEEFIKLHHSLLNKDENKFSKIIENLI